jgi:hypothetical protein
MRKASVSKFLGLFLSVYLTFFIAIVVPFHHHADCNDHQDCGVCLIAHHSIASFNSVALVVTLVCLFVVFLPALLSYNKEIAYFHLRSPPVL